MTIANSKTWRVTRSANLPPIDAVAADGYRNAAMEDRIQFADSQAPGYHTCKHFYGDTVPDNTDYPDATAPIGSLYTQVTIAAGAVVAAALYMKTAAATWEVIGAVDAI